MRWNEALFSYHLTDPDPQDEERLNTDDSAPYVPKSVVTSPWFDWADQLEDASLAGELTWFSGAIKAEVRKPKWLLVTHMFNHQTHHRGQVHCMLTQTGSKPGDTDLPLMPV